jgi:hypothetical protein
MLSVLISLVAHALMRAASTLVSTLGVRSHSCCQSFQETPL